MSDKRFLIVSGVEEAKKYDDPNGLVWEDGWNSDYKCFVVDTEKNVVVFSDGSEDAPEDNFLFRHYGGLVDLLNEVDAERLET